MKLAQVHLGFTEIRAPFDGIMDRFQVRLGSLLDEGALVSTLSDNSPNVVYFNVPEAEYLTYKIKAKKDSINESEPANGEQRTVRISRAGSKPLKQTLIMKQGNIAFRATFPNPKGLLRHGETGNVRMTVPLNNALIIPQKSTFEVLEKKYVFVVDKDNVVRQKELASAPKCPICILFRKDWTRKTDTSEGLRKVSNGEKIANEYAAPDTLRNPSRSILSCGSSPFEIIYKSGISAPMLISFCRTTLSLSTTKHIFFSSTSNVDF